MQGKPRPLGKDWFEVDYERLTAREALELLPGGLAVARGGCRIIASFENGHLFGPVEVYVFRVPAAACHTIATSPRGTIDQQLTEHIARELAIDKGSTKLVVEYAEHEGRLRLHWIDYAWMADVA